MIPRHIAIISGGDGRWVTERLLSRTMGHKADCKAVEQTVRDCTVPSVRCLTVYGFSTENRRRSEGKVGTLMYPFRLYLKKLLKVVREEGCRCKMIDDKLRFVPNTMATTDRLVEGIREDTGMIFMIAANYGGRDELCRASLRLLDAKRTNGDTSLTGEEISDSLGTAGIPDPDLLTRTSGESRLSNSLLQQLAHSGLYVAPLYWPDLMMGTLEDMTLAYNQRERCLGGRIS